MIFAIIGFYVSMIVYHIMSVALLHHVGYEYITIIAIARDIARVCIILGSSIYRYKHIISFILRWKYFIIGTIITLAYSIILSRIQGVSVYNIFIGIKYGFMFIWILLSSLFIGHVLPDKHRKAIQKRLPRIIIGTILVGLIWQASKYIRPDFFHRLGYGPIGDFVFGKEPPIYYRTGPGGEPRLQGLFAGPNNYGYFLAAFFPLLLTWKDTLRSKNKKLLRTIGIIIVVTSILLTLSRTAIIGAAIGAIIVYRHNIKKHKTVAISIILVILAGIIGLSTLKGGSTQEHIINKLSSIQYVIQKPGGYGLGTAGPAIHHQGSILPENYYIQMAIDTGSVGFLLLILTLITLMISIKRHNNIGQNTQTKSMVIGLYILLIMGLFLHVFEDSMVNYLFFIPRGIYLGQQAKK